MKPQEISHSAFGHERLSLAISFSADTDGPTLHVDVFEVQRSKFANAHARYEK